VTPWARHIGAAPDPYARDGHDLENGTNSVNRNAATVIDEPPSDDPRADDSSADEPPPAGSPAGPPAGRGRGRRRADRSGKPVAHPVGGRAGRNLQAAIIVGSGMVAVVLLSLVFWPPGMLGIITLATGVGTWEMVRAIRADGANPPMVPLLGGVVLMNVLAYFAGPDALSLGLLVTVVAALVWRLGDGPRGFQRDLSAIALIAVYVPFLLAFGLLMIRQDDGEWRVLATLVAVVLSDTGGYAFGVFLGKRPMAPSISPKKSWEGFGGSVISAAIGSALLLWLLMDVAPWWGALFGAVLAAVAVLGDLGESMIKRDLKIKDMSQLLPGHGGVMDRLDSILFAVPTAYLLLSLIAPTS
jgi:phosphatidate cytidylyltransferase